MVNRAVELDQRRNGTWLDHRFVWSGSCKSSNGVHGLPSREDEIFDLIAEVPRIGVRIRCTCSSTPFPKDHVSSLGEFMFGFWLVNGPD